MEETNETTAELSGRARPHGAKRPPNPPSPSAATLTAQLAAVRAYLVAGFPEREDAIDAVLTATVAGEHVLLVGPPGTGKSAIARAFAECLGGRSFEYLFTKFSTPEEFLGPFSISGLNADRYERVLGGRLADCEVAFLDELFKSNSASLNALLPILNERLVHQGTAAQSIPLRVAVCASNELPTDSTLGALWDRISLRLFIEPLQSDEHRRGVMLGTTRLDKANRPSLDLSLLDDLDLDAVPIQPGVVDALLSMRRQLEAKGVAFGDRRWVKACRCVRAYALVTGGTEADSMSLGILRLMLWEKPEQRSDVDTMVGKLAAPFALRARETYDAIAAEVGTVNGEITNERISQLLPKLKEAAVRLTKLKEKTSGREADEITRLGQAVRADFGRLRDLLKERYGLTEEVA